MQFCSDLPTNIIGLYADRQGALYLISSTSGLQVWRDGALCVIHKGRGRGVAVSPDELVYYTLNKRVFCCDPNKADQVTDMTENFGGVPGGAERVVCTRDGVVWVEGCHQTRQPDGTWQPAPDEPTNDVTPIPQASDQYGNHWALMDNRLLVLPANDPTTWQTVAAPDDKPVTWTTVIADDHGFIWLHGPGQLACHNPRKPEQAWYIFSLVDDVSASDITALGVTPDGYALAGYADGMLDTLELTPEDSITSHPFKIDDPPTTAIDRLYTDSSGRLWIATDDALYQHETTTDVWKPLGRLPCGNHDIFAAEHEGDLYVVGGLTHYQGYPGEMHVFDELLRYDPALDIWSKVSRMPFPRCYNGIASLNRRLWIVGGAANLSEPDNPEGPREPLNSVVYYDPAQDEWKDGPSLNIERIEPVVLTAGGRIYAIGGADKDDNVLASVESLAPSETAWREEPDLPVPMRQFAGCALGGLLYVCGKSGFYAYDPVEGSWQTDLPQFDPMPQAPLVATHEDKVWVMGGYKSRQTWRYRPRSKRWEKGPEIPIEQSWGAAWSFQNRLMIIGGAHLLETHQVFIFDDRTFVFQP